MKQIVCQNCGAKYKLPERLELIGEMPLGPSRKIDKETLKAMAAETRSARAVAR